MRRILHILLAADTIFLFAAGLFTPMYALYVEAIEGTILDVGVAWSIAAFVFATLQYPFGRLADRYSKKRLLMVQFFGTGAVFALMGSISSVYELFALEFLLGVFMASGDPAFDGLYSKGVRKGKESTEWSLWEMMNGYASALSALVGTAMIFFLGFRTLFMFMFALSFAAGIIIFLCVEDGDKRNHALQ